MQNWPSMRCSSSDENIHLSFFILHFRYWCRIWTSHISIHKFSGLCHFGYIRPGWQSELTHCYLNDLLFKKDIAVSLTLQMLYIHKVIRADFAKPHSYLEISDTFQISAAEKEVRALTLYIIFSISRHTYLLDTIEISDLLTLKEEQCSGVGNKAE